ncbi:MAG: hypothetical protein ACLQM6_14740 [Acidobacteriaceae bacterium]
MKRFACMAILLLSPGLLSAAPAADEPSITGLWKTDGFIAGQQVRMMCALTETKHNLTGICSGTQDGYAAHKIAGSVKGQKVQFYFQAAFGGNSLTLIVSGTLNQDRTEIDGDMEVAPMGGGGMNAEQMNLSGALKAIKELEHDTSSAQAVAAAAQTDATAAQAWAAEAQADLAAGNDAEVGTGAADAGAKAAAAGTEAAAAGAIGPASELMQPVTTGIWKIDGYVMGTSVKMTCVIDEAANKLTGTCSGVGEGTKPRVLTGTVTAKGVSWRFDDAYQGQPITFSMSAKLADDGTKMNGTMSVAPMGVDGTFVAVRQLAGGN